METLDRESVRAIALVAEVRGAWAPPQKMRLSEWSDEYAYLSAESSAEAGKWRTIPYQRGIMDAVTDPGVEQISVMKSARVGYTKIINNTVGYFIHQDPCSVQVVQPTIEDAQGYSKEEIAPMLRDTPVLAGLVSEVKSKDTDNTILQKAFPGGILALVGANSGRGFRRVSRRVMIFDETDGYPASAGTEGDQIKLGIKRTEYYWNRKIIAGSTPLIDETSRIQKLFNQSDQRRFFVPCPHCDAPQFLKWGGKDEKFGIKWPDAEPEKAYYVCEKNGCVIEHKDKRWMIEEADRRQQANPKCPYGWKATAPGNGKHAGFHIWAAYSYSPNATWGDLAREWIDSKDDPKTLQTFVNTALGEVWTQNYSAKIGAEGLAARAENYKLLNIPARGLILTAGVDVQQNRIAVKVKAWGEGEESWLINYTEIHGDPADISKAGPWAQVDSVLLQEYQHESGAKLKVQATAVDTGHFTHEAYIFCRARKRRRVIAIKGSSTAGKAAIGKPSLQDINYKNQVIQKGVSLFLLGTDTIKNTIYGRFKMEKKEGPGVCHFPIGGLPDNYYKMLTAEKQVTKYVNGFPKRYWWKKDGDANEAFDCEVYAYAALQYYYTRTNRNTVWLQARQILDNLKPVKADGETPQPSPKTPPKKSPPRRKTGFVKGWK